MNKYVWFFVFIPQRTVFSGKFAVQISYFDKVLLQKQTKKKHLLRSCANCKRYQREHISSRLFHPHEPSQKLLHATFFGKSSRSSLVIVVHAEITFLLALFSFKMPHFRICDLLVEWALNFDLGVSGWEVWGVV